MLDHILDFRKEHSELKLGIEHKIGIELYYFIIKNNIKTIVETGVAHGFSSWYFLEALKETEGVLYSIEAKLQTVLVVPKELCKSWIIYEKVCPQYLYEILRKLKTVDFFWHDSDHSFGCQFGEYVFADMFNISFIGSHDIKRSGAWEAFLKLFDYKEIISGYKHGVARK